MTEAQEAELSSLAAIMVRELVTEIADAVRSWEHDPAFNVGAAVREALEEAGLRALIDQSDTTERGES